MLITAILIGIAREVCEVWREVITLFSLQLEQRLINAFLTSSEIKELVSSAFLINLEKIKSKNGSRALFNFVDN